MASAGVLMETVTSRPLPCPECGTAAIAILYWDPQTAWKARVHRLRCANKCSVDPKAVLAVLGLSD